MKTGEGKQKIEEMRKETEDRRHEKGDRRLLTPSPHDETILIFISQSKIVIET